MECIRGLHGDSAIVFAPQDQGRRLDVWNVIPDSVIPNPTTGNRRLTCPVHPNEVPISVDHLVGMMSLWTIALLRPLITSERGVMWRSNRFATGKPINR